MREITWSVKVPKMSYCSRFCRRRFTVLDFKSWTYSRIYGHFQQHLYCACAETLIYELPVKILTPPFHSPTQISYWSTKFWRFGHVFHWFLQFICWTSAIFLLPVFWPTDLESIPDASTHVDNSHQVWGWYDHPLPSYSVFVCWYVTWPCDLDLWPFDHEQLSCMAGHRTNLTSEFYDPTPIRSWVMSYNVFHWLPLKMRTRPLRMRRITWPVSRGSKMITFVIIPDPDLPIHYTTFIGLRRRLRVVYSRASAMSFYYNLYCCCYSWVNCCTLE